MRLFPKCLDVDLDAESVLMPHGADKRDLEAALSAVGIYAPRGADWVAWYRASPASVAAVVFDARGEPIVLLFETAAARAAWDVYGESETHSGGERS